MYKIGLYEKEITPLFGNSLCGYFNTRLTDGVIDKTFAKSVVIEDTWGRWWLLPHPSPLGITLGLAAGWPFTALSCLGKSASQMWSDLIPRPG